MDSPKEIRNPIGTVQECEELGLNVKEFPTCHAPSDTVRGCDWAKRDADGVPYCKCTGAMGKSGPKNFAVRIHNGGSKTAIVRQVDCTWIAREYGDIVNNKGAIKIIAGEGESYTTRTGMMDPKTGKREDKDVTASVPVHPRPKDNPDVKPFLEHLAAFKEMQERQHFMNERSMFGVGGGLDAGFEGGAGSGGSGAKEGGSIPKKG